MQTHSFNLTTESLRQLAIDRLGCVDAKVLSYTAKCKCLCRDEDTNQILDWNRGEWFMLSIKTAAGWNIVGRRRTLNELAQFVKQLRKPFCYRAVA